MVTILPCTSCAVRVLVPVKATAFVCGVLRIRVKWSSAPAVPVAVKVIGEPDSPVPVAVRVFVPAVVPSVQLPTVAIPLPFVVVVNPVAEPPPDATAKVMVMPLTGLLLASFTITLGDVATAVPEMAD